MIRLSFGRKKSKSDARRAEEVVRRLEDRSLVLIGLMGCGKSAIGRRLASRLSLPFVDADEEIEKVAGMSISDIFAEYGETHFRDREAKVIARLLGDGPQVLATGGGAFMNADTRCAITRQGVSVWLKAELPVLMRRVSKRTTRPLLQTDDPEAVMRRLMAERYPVYSAADVVVESRDVPHEVIVNEIIDALLGRERLDRRPAV
ncbi:MAG: shikimate kinase [Hyphomicrobiaceae bacterium]|nr:shikimate kinase [Hyphomicrobiaceae bacterium]MCC0007792.1 shikimate kinase [Hyphomicrobiaceae bacterium]